MANLGTLWFGSDIDLTTLKQKIQSGNQSVLDALKMNYDPASYQDMVTKLKSQLNKETFEIKISANTQGLSQNIRKQLSQNTGLTGGLDALNEKIKNQTIAVNALKSRLQQLSATYSSLKSSGMLLQASGYRPQIADTKRELALETKTLNDMIAQRTALRNATQDTLLNLRKEAAEQRNAARVTQQAYRQRQQALREYNEGHIRLNQTLAGGIHVSTQLGSSLSSLFAIDAARQFLGHVIEIGGQLEKQRISIGAILGDTVKATHLFEQIKGLALKSPFGVVELDQYTKQLSAYGFKYNELFDMTKRLADISAGAGTDIGRLTLALGHVRSATYLTGITLRQFSMNNIPMLKMLADYYTEVEKKAVSTAEVQQRISKRQVSYEDVIEQIRRLTDEGGMFFNMQEKISESLAAKYKNLKDAMDIMYGEMAEGTVGDALKSLAGILLQTTRHWKEIANVMGVAATAFMLNKMWIGYTTAAMQANTASTVRQIMAEKQLEAAKLRQYTITRKLSVVEQARLMTSNRLCVADMRQALVEGKLEKEEALRLITLNRIKIAQAMHLVGVQGITKAEIQAAVAAKRWQVALKGVRTSLVNAFSGIGAGTWLTVGAMVGMELYSAYSSWVDRIDDKSNEMKDLIKSRVIDMQKMQKILDNEKGNKPKDNTALKGRIDDMKQVLANSEAYTKTLDEQLSKTADLPTQYDILAKAIGNAVEKNRKLLDYQDTAASMIKASKSDFSWWDIPKGLVGFNPESANQSFWKVWDQLFNNDIIGNIKNLNDAYKELRGTLDNLYEFKEPLKELVEELMNSSDISDKLKSQLKNAPFEEQLQLIVDSGLWYKLEEKIRGTGKQFKMSEAEIKEVCESMKGAFEGVTEEWGEITEDDIPRMFDKMVEKMGGDEKRVREWALNNIDDFKMLMDGLLDQVNEKEPAIRKRIKSMFLNLVRLKQIADGLSKDEVGEGIAAGAAIGASVIMNIDFDEEELADIQDKTTTSPKDKNSKDKQLEAAKTRLAQYKAFLSEYKKYRELYNKEKAISILETLFPDLKDEKGKFIGERLVDDYTGVLNELKNTLKATTEARKKFHNEIDKTNADTLLDREKESLKRNADAMKEYTKKMEDQWKLYRSLMEKTGENREFAQLAFTDGAIWDDTAKKMLEKFNERVSEIGGISLDFHWNMKEEELKATLVDADGVIQEDMIELAKKIQAIITGNYKKILEESAEAINKAMTNTQKLDALEERINQKRIQRDQYNGNNSTFIKGLDAQIKNLEKERDKLKIKQQEETGEFLQFYSAVLSMTSEQAEEVGRKIRENLVQQLRDGTISGDEYVRKIKKIDDQLSKVREKKDLFALFRSGGMEAVRKFQLEVSDAELTNASNKLSEKQEELKDANEKLQEAIEALTDVVNDDNSTEQDFEAAQNNVILAEDNVAGAAEGVKAAEQEHENAQKNRDTADKNYQSAKKFQSSIAAIAYVVHLWAQAYDDAKKAAAAYGENLDANLNATGQAIMGTIQGVDSGIQRAQSGDILGAVSGIVFGTIANIANMHDETLKEDQKNSQLIVQQIGNMTERLERALERNLGGIYETKAGNKELKQLYEYIGQNSPWDTEQEKFRRKIIEALGGSGNKAKNQDTQDAINAAIKSESLFDVEYAQLLMQRDQLYRQLEDEQGMKNKDESKIEDYKSQIDDLEDQIEHFAEDVAKSLYDIDIKSWASGLGDSLFEAWQKGESGAEAFKKKAREVIADVAKKIAVTKLIETALQPVLKAITNEMEEKDGRLDAESISAIAEAMSIVGTTLPDSFNSLMDGIDQGLQRAGLGSMKDDASDTSGTSSGIKSITENTADLLSSYINAIRADVSMIRIQESVSLPAISEAIQRTNVIAEAQVTLQTQIAANTLRNADAADKIYDLLHKVAPDGTKFRIQ